MPRLNRSVEAPPETDGVGQMPSIEDKAAVKVPVVICDLPLVVRDTMIPSLVLAVNTPGHSKIVFRSGSVQRRRPLLSVYDEHVIPLVPLPASVGMGFDGEHGADIVAGISGT